MASVESGLLVAVSPSLPDGDTVPGSGDDPDKGHGPGDGGRGEAAILFYWAVFMCYH